jgi:hypothetical protein
MADEEKEKAEKVAAAKKRVGSPLQRLLSSWEVVARTRRLDLIPLLVVELGFVFSVRTCANSMGVVRTVKETEGEKGGRHKEEG